MRRMFLKPPIGGPGQGRPAKRLAPTKGRIKPIDMAPARGGEAKRNYLVGSKGSQNATPQKKFGTLTLGPKVRGVGRPIRNKPYAGPRHGVGL